MEGPSEMPPVVPSGLPPRELTSEEIRNARIKAHGGLKPNQYRDAKGVIRTRKPDPEPIENPEDELAAMRRVLAGKAADHSPLDQAFKDFLARDPAKFMAQKRALEKPVGSGEPNDSPAKLVRDGETPCPLCKQIVYPEDKGTARLLAETQLRNIPNVIKERPKLLARIAELEAHLAERIALNEN